MIKLLDFYFKKWVITDLIVSAVIMAILFFRADFYTQQFDFHGFDNIISNLISTLVSFIGFIMTALTVIVTVKSSLKIRDINEAENGLQLLLSSDNYKRIISVFKFAIIELFLALLLIYCLWIPFFLLPYYVYIGFIAIVFFIISISVFRTVYVFFNIIFLEFTD